MDTNYFIAWFGVFSISLQVKAPSYQTFSRFVWLDYKYEMPLTLI